MPTTHELLNVRALSDALDLLNEVVAGGFEFRAQLDALGGYDVSEVGKLVWES